MYHCVVLQVLYIMSDGTPEQNLKQIFKIFDLNSDGKINHQEMNKITKDLSKLFNEDKGPRCQIFHLQFRFSLYHTVKREVPDFIN